MVLRPTIEVFGKYRLLAEAGHGGMADVFLAISVGPAGFGKLQVIKRLRASLAEEPELRAMLLDEARLAAQLNHRNIVQTIEVGSVDDKYFIAMELLDGQPFNRITRRCKMQGTTFPLELTLKLLSEMLAGLHYAHEAKDYDGNPLAVVHRDVSPQNVFITYDGQVKVMDFGIAKAAHRAVETQTGVVRGKVAYMAPEQALPKTKRLDARADVFSVGVMLWEALARARMWAGMGDPEILLKLSTVGAPPLPQRADIPAELARICARALMRDRNERYATAAEMRADIEAYLQKLGAATTPETMGEQVSRLFAEDRVRLQKVVEQQLATLRASDIADDPSTWTSSSRRILVSPSGMEMRGETTNATGTTNGGNQAMVRSSPPSDVTASHTNASIAPAPSRAWMIGLGMVLAAGALFVMRDRVFGVPPPPVPAGPPDPSVTVAPTAAPVVPTAATATGTAALNASSVQVRVLATPPSARIMIDGIAVGANPFEGRLVKDVAMHRVLVDAPGYAPQGRMVPFDADVDLTIALVPREKEKPVVVPVPSAAPTVIPGLEPLRPR